MTLELPNKFCELYKCNIGPTGEVIYKTPQKRPFFIPLTKEEKTQFPNEREIAIKMPESEYIRFMQNWNLYMDIMRVSHNYPHVKDQFETLAVMANMLK
jgi:hypothetical protein